MYRLPLLLAACANADVDPWFELPPPNAPSINHFGSARAEYDGFGAYTYSVAGSPFLVVADEGLSCRPSWSMGALLRGGILGGKAPFIPAGSATGLVQSLPVPMGAQELIGLPIGDGYYYWSGGEIEIVDWTADHLLVELRDGEVCGSDLDAMDVITCTPSTGTIDVYRGDIPGPLDEEVDLGWRGESLQMIDPATNEPLCDHVTSGPGTTDTSSGTTNR